MKKQILLLVILSVIPFATGCGNKGVVVTEKTTPTEYFAVLAQKAANIQGLSYDIVTNTAGTSTKSKMSVMGEKTRIDDERTSGYMIIDGNKMINYDPETKTAMIMEDSEGPNEMFDVNTVEKTNMKLLEKTTKNGYECRMVQSIDKNGTANICMSEEYGIPISMEIASPEGKMTMDYLNIKVGKLPMNLFELPANTKTVKVPSYN